MSHNRLSKHDIKEDNFVTTVLRAREFIYEHQNAFFAGLIAVIVMGVMVRREADAYPALVQAMFGAGQYAATEYRAAIAAVLFQAARNAKRATEA